MTELTGIELSKKVADLYGIDASSFYSNTPLHEDSARCFELMVNHGLLISRSRNILLVSEENGKYKVIEVVVNKGDIDSHRTAILQCLIKMKEQL